MCIIFFFLCVSTLQVERTIGSSASMVVRIWNKLYFHFSIISLLKTLPTWEKRENVQNNDFWQNRFCFSVVYQKKNNRRNLKFLPNTYIYIHMLV